MNRYRALAALLTAVVLSSCEKNAVQEIAGPPAATSRIRFFNFGLNAPIVNLFANGAKLTAANSLNGVDTTGTGYGAAGAGGFYTTITPGQVSLTPKIATPTNKGVVIATLPITIADGKYYSFYMSGPYDAVAKSVDGFVVEDPFFADTTDFSTARVRFVNAIYNSQPMTLFAKNTTTAVEVPIGGLVAYKAAGAFTPVPNGVYDLSTRVAGASTNTIVRTAVSFVAGKIYTISARGDITISSTTATNRPFLDNTANK